MEARASGEWEVVEPEPEPRPPAEPEPEPEPEPPQSPPQPFVDALGMMRTSSSAEAPRPPVRIWVGSWNTAVSEDKCPDLTPGGSTSLDTFARFVPTDCDVYIMGLQEGSPENDGDRFFSQLDRFLRERGPACTRLRPPGGQPDRIFGRGDGSFINPKFTGIAAWRSERMRSAVEIVRTAGASAGVSEGSKGAIGMVLRVHDTTLLAINCHLAKHDVERRREQYGLLCRMLGEGLALPGSAGTGDIHSQYHHIIWFGDMNYPVQKETKGGCTSEQAVDVLRMGELKPLYHFDELYQDLDLMEEEDERKPKAFCGFSEPPKWTDGPMPTRFFPTYKKDPKRGEKGNVIPQDGQWESDPDWVRRVYCIDYADYWYKGGGTKLRMPSWTDRILYRSMPHLTHTDAEGNTVPNLRMGMRDGNAAGACDKYRAVNDVLLSSDHSPICAVFEMDAEDCRNLPHYSKMSKAQLAKAQKYQGLGQLRVTLLEPNITTRLHTPMLTGDVPAKYIVQCPAPFETPRGAMTSPEIHGGAQFVMEIVAASARPDAAAGASFDSPVVVGTSVRAPPTVTVPTCSLEPELCYSLCFRVWPGQAPTTPIPRGCGWDADDALGCTFKLPVWHVLEEIKAKEARGEPGRVLHSAALLRMPPSAMAGRPTGAYLRVFVELEHAASDQNLPPVTRTRAV